MKSLILCFNPRPRTSGRLDNSKRVVAGVSFNPRPRTSGRPSSQMVERLGISFNPRPRTSGRPVEADPEDSCHQFQSTPPYKRATKDCNCQGKTTACFNPRPRTSGRQKISEEEVKEVFVSIHAPVQAGDGSHFATFPKKLMFQSTPPYKRAT